MSKVAFISFEELYGFHRWISAGVVVPIQFRNDFATYIQLSKCGHFCKGIGSECCLCREGVLCHICERRREYPNG